MRKILFVTFGLIELALAGVLVLVSQRLPSQERVEDSTKAVQQVLKQTGEQVGFAKTEIEGLRDPNVQQSLAKIQKDLPKITEMLRNQNLSYDSLRQMKMALGNVRIGAGNLAKTLDPKDAQKLSLGLKTTADYFEKEVGPAASNAAQRLEKSTTLLAADAKALAQVLKGATPDLQSAQDIHDSLGKLSQGLSKVSAMIDPAQLKTMREGFSGIEESLSLGSQQVSRLAGYSYPVVTFDGIVPEISQRAFWPQGKQIAASLAKGAKGISAAGKQMDRLNREMPQITKSILESQNAAKKTQAMLAHALKNRAKLEKVLKEIPQTSMRLAKEMPMLSQDLAKMLRETQKRSSLGKSLREAQKRVDLAVQSWPTLKTALDSSVDALAAMEKQLDLALNNESNHKLALRQTLELTEALGRMLPAVSSKYDQRLHQRAESLGQMQTTLKKAENQIPALSEGVVDMMSMIRWALWLFAGIVALHGLCTFTLARSPTEK